MPTQSVSETVSEREKWDAEKEFRDREIKLKEQAQINQDTETRLKEEESRASKWRNPLVIAIIAAALAGLSNAIVAAIDGRYERQLQQQKSEQQRILEMIKTGDRDKASINLHFLLNAGLITDPKLKDSLGKFLRDPERGQWPMLPDPSGASGASAATTRPNPAGVLRE
jgi:hypothetical protein